MRIMFKSVLAAAALIVTGATAPRAMPTAPIGVPAFDGDLSVLTYNVHGLPWPVASGRPADLAAIGARLRDLRAHGQAPHIVVLQEAFTADARAIGPSAGYRYIVDGPSAEAAAPALGSASDRAFAAAAHWWSGETEGKLVGSGLQILSDYPVVARHAMAFPAFTCAGFDCLANKGALLVSVAVPGVATPVDIVTTHLNSRAASGVANDRSDKAYARQVGLLADFVRDERDPRHPLIVAGDFNVGKAFARRSALLGQASANWTAAGVVRDALGVARDRGFALSADARTSLRRAKDWQFFAPGSAAALDLTGIAVPFGHDASGTMLSDHIGYVARFRLSPGTEVAAATTKIARSRS